MKRVKLTVAYDGTNYCGWQVQPNGLAVQEVLNRCLSEFLGTETEVIGASRTDAGVHAATGYPYSGFLPGAGRFSSAVSGNHKDI